MGGLASIFNPKMPKLEGAARMPDPEDPALIEARRKRLAQMSGRGGRSETILSESLMGSAGKIGA